MVRIVPIVAVCILVAWHSMAAASEEWRQNTQLLPQYCKDRAKGVGSAEFKKWRGTFGEAFPHIHHYCDGIYAEQKAKGTLDQRQRKRWLATVLHEMQYVGRHCQSRCVLYPELHSRWGWALRQTGQPAEAIKHFQLAIRAKPKYTPAYAKLSDLYVELEQSEDARRVLRDGLEIKPDSRMLNRRLEKLEKSQ